MLENNNRIRTYYIYKTTNNINGKTYIGQKLCPLNKTPGTNTEYLGSGKLYKLSEKKYGKENFTKEILAVCHSKQIIDILEIQYISLYKEIGKAEYNIAGGGQTYCRQFMSEEEKKIYNQHMSEGIRNSKKHKLAMKNPERNRKISEAHKGKPSPFKGIPLSEERCREMSERMNNLYKSPKGEEVRAKIREKRKFQVITDETRLKISLASIGKPKSEETRKRMSESQKGHVVSEETKAKIREARKHQAPMSEESKQKFKESIAAFWNSPKGQEQKRINSEKLKERKLTKGFHWFNNGIHNIQSKECPEGFVPGRLGDFTCSEETKQKKRDIERNMTDEQRKKRSENISKAHMGKHFTEEQKKHIGDANRGRKYYNNGIIEVMRFECPEGFVPGRCPKAKQSIKKGMNDK